MDIGAQIFNNEQVFDSDLPKIDNLVFTGIELKYKRVILLNSLVYLCVLIGLCFLASLIFDESSIYRYLPFFYGLALAVLIGVYLLKFMGFRLRKYAVRSKDITYSKGLLVTKLTTVPFKRMQHIDVSQGFFSKRIGLAKLTVYTAGESGGDLSVNGLTLHKANDLREFIMEKVNA